MRSHRFARYRCGASGKTDAACPRCDRAAAAARPLGRDGGPGLNTAGLVASVGTWERTSIAQQSSGVKSVALLTQQSSGEHLFTVC